MKSQGISSLKLNQLSMYNRKYFYTMLQLFSSDGELIKTFDISDLKFKTIPNIIIGIGMSYTTCRI